MDESLSGYEMGALIKQSTSNFWQESDASIYPTLKLMLSEGLVSSESQFVGKRRKEIFSITDKGKQAFLEWFKRPPDPDVHREEFLLKLFFTDASNEKFMRSHCQARLKDLLETKATFREIEKVLKQELPEKTYWLKTLQVGLAHLELDITWIEEIAKFIYPSKSPF